jgi:hypothetical protein
MNAKDAYLHMFGKQKAYFCNEEHYDLFVFKKEEERRIKQEELEARRKQKQEEHDLAVKQRKADKDKAYYLICEIIGRKEILHKLLWKEWALWNKVASNKEIGTYLENNKNYLCTVLSRIDNNEFSRIKYLSGILRNSLGDFKANATIQESPKPIVRVDETFYEPVKAKNNKRRSLEDLEDEFNG